MPQRILALELDAHEMKAAVIETTFRDYRVAGFYRDPVTVDGGSLADQVRAFLARHQLQGNTVLSSLPGDLVSLRTFYLPFKDSKRLAQTVPFELEAQVPFDLDDVVIDYDVLGRDRTGSNVIAALVQRDDLEAHLALLREVGLDPKVVDSAPLATLNFLSLFGKDLPPTFAYIGGNTRRVVVALFRNRQLVGLRTVVPGAVATSDDVGVPVSDNGHAANVTARTTEVLKEIRWTLLALNGAPLDDDLPCLVAGDGIEFQQIGPLLEAAIGCRVQHLEQAQLRTVPQALRSELPNFASSLGLALGEVNAEDALGVNFRRGLFAYHRGEDEIRRAMWRSGALAVLVVTLMIANTYMGYQQMTRHLELVEQQIRNVFTTTLPDVTRIVDPKAQLKAEIEDLQRKVKIMVPSSAAAIDVMRTLSAGLPPELKIDIDDYIIDLEGIKAKAKSDSFEAVDAIKQQISGTHAFGDVQVKDVKAAPDGRGIDFRLVITLSKEGGSAGPEGAAAGGAQGHASPGRGAAAGPAQGHASPGQSAAAGAGQGHAAPAPGAAAPPAGQK